MRAIASGFNDIDYRLYDMACDEESEVEQRYKTKNQVSAKNEINIIPNPNNGQFIIKHSNAKIIETISMHRIDGILVRKLNKMHINKAIELQGINGGVYYIRFQYVNGMQELIKMVLNN